jgi:hypothetical protein
MQYVVQVVDESDLPAGMDTVIVERSDGTAVMLVTGRPAQVWLAMRAWEDSREARCVPSLLYAVS